MVAEKTAKNFRGQLYIAEPCTCPCTHTDYNCLTRFPFWSYFRLDRFTK